MQKECFPAADCLLPPPLMSFRSAPFAWRSSSPRTSWGSVPVNMPSTESECRERDTEAGLPQILPSSPRRLLVPGLLGPLLPFPRFLPSPIPGEQGNCSKSPLWNELEPLEQQKSSHELAKPLHFIHSKMCMYVCVCVCVCVYLHIQNLYIFIK